MKGKVLKAARVAIVAAVALVVTAQIVQLAAEGSSLVVRKGILLARDNDAAVFVEKAQESGWFVDIIAPYGPLYYRVAATIQKADALVAGALGTNDSRDESFCRVMVFMSLASMMAVLLIITAGAAWGAWQRCAVFGILLFLLLSHWLFAWFSFRIYPEFFLAILITAATFFTMRIPLVGTRLRTGAFYAASVLWGLACLAKSNAGTFAIGYIVVLSIPFQRGWRSFGLRTLETFIAGCTMLTTFFAIGYPQALRVTEQYEGLSKYMGARVQSFDWIWAFDWVLHYLRHFLPLSVAVFVCALVFGRRERDSRHVRILGGSWLVIVLPLIPLAAIIKTHLIIPTRHYAITVVCCMLCAQIFIQRRWVDLLRDFMGRHVRGSGRAPSWLNRETVSYGCAAAIAGFVAVAGPIPGAITESVAKQADCFAEAEAMASTISTRRSNPKQLLIATPYFPIPDDQPYRLVWSLQEKWLAGNGAKFLGINEEYANRYRGEVSDYNRLKKPWQQMQKFFRKFSDRASAKDPRGRTWKKVFTTKCNLTLWERQDGPRRKVRGR
ncbi:MAG: hypothetical protein PHU25_04010 [Deltaproteobacteria bacterium]|nr:hypothetical protein [Deltaproteobacteria bacterium]